MIGLLDVVCTGPKSRIASLKSCIATLNQIPSESEYKVLNAVMGGIL